MDASQNSGPAHDDLGPPYGPIATFAIKTAIVAGIAVIAFQLMLTLAERSVMRTVANVTDTREFWKSLEDTLHANAAESFDMPKIKQDQIAADIRVIARRMRPFIEAAQEALPAAGTDRAR